MDTAAKHLSITIQLYHVKSHQDMEVTYMHSSKLNWVDIDRLTEQAITWCP